MGTIIRILLENITLTLLVLGFLATGLALLFKPRPLTSPVVTEALLACFILFSIALSYFYNFVMHVFFGEMVAHFIGWADSPFQREVGFASLGFAAVGLLAFRGGFQVRLAAILGPALFLFGAAGGHIYEIIQTGNHAPGNAGAILYTDIGLPLLGFFLLWLHYRASAAERAGKH